MLVLFHKCAVELISDLVFSEDNPSSPESARALRHLGMKQAMFKLRSCAD